MSMKIGVMDSGSGGLSILAALHKRFTSSSFVYCGDSVAFPYSPKSPAELQERAVVLTKLLQKQNCDLIVIACNTLTVHAISLLREQFRNTPFVGTVPAIAEAARVLPQGSTTLILATQATAESEYLKKLLAPLQSKLTWQVLGATELVRAVETSNTAAQYAVVEDIKKRIHTVPIGIVIGCTHFSAAKPALSTLSETEVLFFEPQTGICNQVARIQDALGIDTATAPNTASSITWFDTGNTAEQYQKNYARL